ncbi:MAG TPA: hypothetical protein PKE57_08685 [Cellvibrionaceae bacterium]|nr:hypothetical protein [Cellvibrionaceae bacterium]HMW73232.1 hypothetical protein [Cellvibrionaceae bacterium]HMY38116.1 hypothetical protein [Marinagarivorans sp.]HNG60923.1 hypothetical protein [Cellvibrionaceae bacterium]
MNKLVTSASLIALCALASVAQAATIEINFDGVNSGSSANSAAPSGIVFYQAHYVNDVDAYGDEISNTQKWQIDSQSTADYPVTVDNPASFGYGAAPSGTNALNALWQPVLMRFESALDLTGFSTVLDNSTYGDILPAAVYFLDSNKKILSQIAVDQTVPGAVATLTTPVNGVREVLFSSGAFYDTVQISSVPLPPSAALFLSGLALLGTIKYRKKRTQE